MVCAGKVGEYTECSMITSYAMHFSPDIPRQRTNVDGLADPVMNLVPNGHDTAVKQTEARGGLCCTGEGNHVRIDLP
jgi:hypothetical protein